MITLVYGNETYVYDLTDTEAVPASEEAFTLEIMDAKESLYNDPYRDYVCRLRVDALTLPLLRKMVKLPVDALDGQDLILAGDLALSVFLTLADHYE